MRASRRCCSRRATPTSSDATAFCHADPNPTHAGSTSVGYSQCSPSTRASLRRRRAAQRRWRRRRRSRRPVSTRSCSPPQRRRSPSYRAGAWISPAALAWPCAHCLVLASRACLCPRLCTLCILCERALGACAGACPPSRSSGGSTWRLGGAARSSGRPTPRRSARAHRASTWTRRRWGAHRSKVSTPTAPEAPLLARGGSSGPERVHPSPLEGQGEAGRRAAAGPKSRSHYIFGCSGGGWQATASRSSSSPTAGGTRGCPSRDPLTPLGQRVCTYAADTHITGVTSQVTMLYKKRSCCIFFRKERRKAPAGRWLSPTRPVPRRARGARCR